MAYDFYLDKTLLPVTPQKLQVKIAGNNKKLNLINEGEVNILKAAGLTDITFTALFPNTKYPFARYDGAFKDASFFLDELERLKTRTDEKGKYLPFQFIVSRALPNGTVLFDTNLKAALESYTIVEDAKANGLDVSVNISLKQYKAYGTKTVEIIQQAEGQTQITASTEPQRPAENPPTRQSYTVIKGDSLCAIAKKMLGDGSRYAEIYGLNKDTIDSRNKGTGNTKYTIYPGQTFIIP